jgi:hypothetical protein
LSQRDSSDRGKEKSGVSRISVPGFAYQEIVTEFDMPLRFGVNRMGIIRPRLAEFATSPRMAEGFWDAFVAVWPSPVKRQRDCFSVGHGKN